MPVYKPIRMNFAIFLSGRRTVLSALGEQLAKPDICPSTFAQTPSLEYKTALQTTSVLCEIRRFIKAKAEGVDRMISMNSARALAITLLAICLTPFTPAMSAEKWDLYVYNAV